MKPLIGIIMSELLAMLTYVLGAPKAVGYLVIVVGTLWSLRRLLGRLVESSRGRAVIGALERLSAPVTEGDTRPTQQFADTILITDHALRRFRQRAGLPGELSLTETERLLRALFREASHFETDRPYWAPSQRGAQAWLIIGKKPEGWLLAILDVDKADPHQMVVKTVEVNESSPAFGQTVCTWEEAYADRLIDFPPPIMPDGRLSAELFYAALRRPGIGRVRAQYRLQIPDRAFAAYTAAIERAVSDMRQRYPRTSLAEDQPVRHQVSGRTRFEAALSIALPFLLIGLLFLLAAVL